MSEEKNVLDQIPIAENAETFVFSSSSGAIQIEFADGLKAIPNYIVQAVGGIETLKEKAPQFKKVNSRDFFNGIDNRLRKNAVNEFQQSFVDAHFGNMY